MQAVPPQGGGWEGSQTFQVWAEETSREWTAAEALLLTTAVPSKLYSAFELQSFIENQEWEGFRALKIQVLGVAGMEGRCNGHCQPRSRGTCALGLWRPSAHSHATRLEDRIRY